MTVYTVPVADGLLLQRDAWLPVPGFRLLEIVGPWPAHPHVTLCTFEDDGAPEEFAGKLVEPVISRVDGQPVITDRVVVGGAR